MSLYVSSETPFVDIIFYSSATHTSYLLLALTGSLREGYFNKGCIRTLITPLSGWAPLVSSKGMLYPLSPHSIYRDRIKARVSVWIQNVLSPFEIDFHVVHKLAGHNACARTHKRARHALRYYFRTALFFARLFVAPCSWRPRWQPRLGRQLQWAANSLGQGLDR